MLKGHGNAGGKVMFIVDCGSKDDAASGYALSANSERTLRQLCNQIGLKLDTCWRTALYKTYLPLGYSKRNDKKAVEEYVASMKPLDPHQILLDEIREVDPNLIVVMGDYALKYLTGASPLAKFRGSILKTGIEALGRPYKVIPVFGPRHINETYSRFFITSADFENKIKEHLTYPNLPPDGDLVWICRTAEEAQNFFRRHINNSQFVTFDIETWCGIPTCISFCFDGKEAVSIPWVDPKMSMADNMLLIRECARILGSGIPKVNQNIKYDWTILERFGFNVNEIVGDTMLATHNLYPEFEKNLGFLTSLYTNVPYFKDEGKESQSYPPDKDHLLYNAKDALVTHKIYSHQLKEMKEEGVYPFYKNVTMPLFFIYKGMEGRGVRVDDERRQKLLAKYQVLTDLNQGELNNLVGYEFNPRSPDQVGRLIYEDLKYPKRSKTEKGVKRYKTDRKTLEELKILHGPSNKLGEQGELILAKIILARRLAKVIEYIQTPIHPDGRWRASWNIAGTETCRTSASKSIDQLLLRKNGKFKMVKLGRSLQTITKHGFKLEVDTEDPEANLETYTDLGKDLRVMFVPSPGYEFVEIDQSQAEARHVAVLSEDWETLAVLEKTDFKRNRFGVKDDLHTVTAMWVTGFPFEEIDDAIRNKKGKPARHGGNYGLSPAMLALLEHISIKEATTILNRFHEYSPKIRGVFHAEIRSAIQRTRTLVNPFGFRRVFYDRIDNELFKAAYSHIPQGTVSLCQKLAMLRAEPQISGFAHFLVEAHDSTLAEVKKGYREKYAEIMKRELMTPVDYSECTLSRSFRLVVPVEMEYSEESWGELRKFDV